MEKILLVEDDPLLIDIYTTKLKEAGFEVEVATDGEAALNKLRQKKPDLLVLDIILPNINGWGVLKIIKSDSSFNHLKVLILSNLGQKAEVEKGLKMGAGKYLIKAHYTPAEVVEEIKKMIKT